MIGGWLLAKVGVGSMLINASLLSVVEIAARA